MIHRLLFVSLLTVQVVAVASPRLVAEEVHWSFRRFVRPVVPEVNGLHTGRTSVDRFLLAKLHDHNLSFSPDADRATLCRRTYLDLVGLPPSPDEVDEFQADSSPDAFERLLDRLLSSPHFGERWGRHWLDVAGYTDTVGFDIDANNIVMPAGKWRYRHYVIDSFNGDKPYRQFIREQLAGDELVDWRHADVFTNELRESLIATGFLRTAQDFTHEPESNIELNQFAVLHDTLEIVGASLLGLTLHCARCHDHKFDPVTQQDYYRLMAFFTPAYNPQAWKPVFPWKPEIMDRGLPDVPPGQFAVWRQENEQLDREIDERRRQISTIRDQRQAELAKTEEAPQDGKVSEQQITDALTADEQQAIAALHQEIAERSRRKRTWNTIQALYDVGPPPQTHLLNRGDHRTPGEVVSAGFLAVLDADHHQTSALTASTASSGHRLTLADWLTTPETPAFALQCRVMTNRVWQHLFGRGLVATPENFGLTGEPPSHPELLEWLSSELPRREGRIKPLIRELMSSQVYRQTSRPPQTLVAHPDPGNRLYWRMPLRQLDAEVIRDSMLTVTGQLSTEFGGPPVRLISRPDGLVTVDEKTMTTPTEKNRRSVYLMFRRAYNLSLLTVFDVPFIATTCPQRDASAVVSQSLTMLNDEFLFQQSDLLAGRLARESGASERQQIERAFRLVLGRLPHERERKWCQQFLADQSQLLDTSDEPADAVRQKPLSQLCRALFNTSEFLYAE